MRSGFLLLLVLVGCSTDQVNWAFDPHQEEGVHGNVEIEWWYHWGFLTDENGNEWAAFSSFFRTKSRKLPVTRYFLYDLTDLKSGKRSQRSAAGAELLPLVALAGGPAKLPPPHEVIPGLPAEKPGDPLRLRYGEDLLERTGPNEYRLKVGDVNLLLKGIAEPMAVEGTGLTGIERPDDMCYYTVPRLNATGTVRGVKATGVFWYDHQWGATWTGPSIGWSWWGLQLDDGTHVNAYVLRDLKTHKLIRSVCTHDRRVYPLDAIPTDHWDSPTKVRYPVSWKLKAGPLELRVEPIHKERETAVLGDQESIWEGPVKVTGSVTGRGYQELVSYARERRRGN